MSKPRSMPVPGVQPKQERRKGSGGPEPLSGSKKVKNRNHVDHNNPEG
ncbi:small acid-soluble spore protein P [Paenibacillus pinistramenti]|nr:small acid-soluble spore protein P [Paenibacillus pinistramenti]